MAAPLWEIAIHDKVVLNSFMGLPAHIFRLVSQQGSGEIMLKRFVVAFAILALALASAGTVPAPGSSYKVTLMQPSVVKGNELKAGEYRLNLGVEKVTIVNGKLSIEVPVTVESVDKKFETTAIRYTDQNGKASISEIRLGGTKTKLVFNP
jgi:hypothetical protein